MCVRAYVLERWLTDKQRVNLVGVSHSPIQIELCLCGLCFGWEGVGE